jgi:hypothetical protein
MARPRQKKQHQEEKARRAYRACTACRSRKVRAPRSAGSPCTVSTPLLTEPTSLLSRRRAAIWATWMTLGTRPALGASGQCLADDRLLPLRSADEHVSAFAARSASAPFCRHVGAATSLPKPRPSRRRTTTTAMRSAACLRRVGRHTHPNRRLRGPCQNGQRLTAARAFLAHPRRTAGLLSCNRLPARPVTLPPGRPVSSTCGAACCQGSTGHRCRTLGSSHTCRLPLHSLSASTSQRPPSRPPCRQRPRHQPLCHPSSTAAIGQHCRRPISQPP